MSREYWILIGYLLTACTLLQIAGRVEGTKYNRFAWPLCLIGGFMILLLIFVGIFWGATGCSP